tara:strand:+ start:6081 stop:6242 length:162 start_codon:yes stop_codon:yes gene_type:complete
MSKKKQFCYVIKERSTNMLQGAFPYSEEGKKMAEKYLRKNLKGKLKDYKIEVQ